jgi:hypothetical protein
VSKRRAAQNPTLTAGLKCPPEILPDTAAIAAKAKPYASATLNDPIVIVARAPLLGAKAARRLVASTPIAQTAPALANTVTKVPQNSAASFRGLLYT